jgi:hypothetical protein
MTRWRLWHQRQIKATRTQQAQRFHDLHIANQVAWREVVPIEDLRDPHGKRFLFDDFEGMAQQTTLLGDAIPAARMTPLQRYLAQRGRPQMCVRERVCVPTCDGCAQIRTPER